MESNSDTTIAAHPTPYADVNAVLHDFAVQIQALLGDHCSGMYLYGSLALGDFDPHTSDIDFLVVTDTELADDLIQRLADMHQRFEKSGSPWSEKIEAAYIPQDALHHTAPTEAAYPQFEKERSLFKEPLEPGWIFQRYTLYEHGIRVVGPDPRQMFKPVEPLHMWQAAAVIARTWNLQIDDPEWLAWARLREAQAFIALTLCRLFYTLDTAAVASKPAAARWAKRTLEQRWSPLIARALAGQRESGEAPEYDLNETLAMIQYTTKQIEHKLASHPSSPYK